jgi:hypothetical protein
VKRSLLAAALVLATPAARAESPRYGAFEFRLSGYRPNIDAEFGGQAHPYSDVLGGGRGLMARGALYRSLYVGIGTLDVGVGAGYWEKYGHGLLQNGQQAADTTALKIVPLSAIVSCRFDWLADQLGVPLAPYARFALERYWWWVNTGSGKTAVYQDAGGGRMEGAGATNGYSFTLGLALQLDFFDRSMAADMDRDTGINHTYLFFDATRSYVSDFHSAKSWDLSDDRWTLAGGLLFVF